VRPIEDDRVPGQLERGDVDIALLTPDGVSPDLHARHLFEEHYVCALREDHPDVIGGALSLDRFCALDHALVSYKGERFWGVTDDVLAQGGRARRVVLSVTSFLILLEVLRTSDLIAVVPQKLLADTQGVAVLDPPIEIPGFTKVAAWHERTHHDPGHRWVRTLLFETCEALGCHLHGRQQHGTWEQAEGVT
jgi:DNA-binding transcriptional LysR family regulator